MTASLPLPSSTPITVPGLSGVTQITASAGCSGALSAGSAFGWGYFIYTGDPLLTPTLFLFGGPS